MLEAVPRGTVGPLGDMTLGDEGRWEMRVAEPSRRRGATPPGGGEAGVSDGDADDLERNRREGC